MDVFAPERVPVFETRSGAKTSMIWISDDVRNIAPPSRQLAACSKTTLSPGQATTVNFNIPLSQLYYECPPSLCYPELGSNVTSLQVLGYGNFTLTSTDY